MVCERKIIEEMENHKEKYFKHEVDSRTNQQLIGLRESLRGLVEREWMSLPHETADYGQCDDFLVVKGEHVHSEFWKQRCATLYYPNAQKNDLQTYLISIKNEVISG